MLGNPGEELFAAVVKVKFILWVDEEGRVGKNEDGTVEYDLTQFCGPQQFEHSDKFIKALNQIAAFDEKLGQSDAVITIPVKVNFQVLVGTGNNYARSLLDIKEAEQAIKARWSSYVYNEKGANENLSFRFVLEPMILDICCADMTLEMVKSVENLMLVHRNCFKRVDIHLEDEFASVQATQQLMTCICDTSHRFRGPPNTNYHYELENSTEIYEPPQVGTLELMCDESMQESAFAAFWSAVVLTQSTKNLVFCMESMMNIDRSREHWWKWVAYGLFSKLALVLQLKL
ncbi:hypothetical protein PF005_g14398 [Phytophthora fragariae]|nr:hypothetical protein PF009_g15755 [Phytophthora fragariae]KAE9100774.1 hypothetical protein PF007_g15388 [Phytophthora fragariae]KAE9100887.1 hypothetical protein PF010_g14647 [Phytophthora fragariae]KAE9137400.1 hypothetical protein PF006_g14192 [Phytophthora fragariae]KAE9202908.1 hypothetical protein PF005_g14398 [Phytophthora fragariae]